MSAEESSVPICNEMPAAPAERPLATGTLLVLLCAIFGFEMLWPVGDRLKFSPSVETLVADGGLIRDLVVERGEWYRILTGPLLHGGFLHILMNGLALWSIGRDLERMVGRTWLFVLFFLGAVGGAVGSLSINPPQLVSVGASGAIMCLIAASFVILFRSRQQNRAQLQTDMFQALFFSLLPLLGGGGGPIDGAAHLGGTLTGFALGGLLWLTWKDGRPTPLLTKPARGLAVVGLLLFAAAIYGAITPHDAYARTAGLIPNSEMPDLDDDMIRQGPGLIYRYPSDPRSHWLQAKIFAEHDPASAERELRLALADPLLETRFLPDLKRRLDFELAGILVEEGKSGEARELAQPFCRLLDDMLRKYQKELCPLTP
jgi:rhomboid protease GluP